MQHHDSIKRCARLKSKSQGTMQSKNFMWRSSGGGGGWFNIWILGIKFPWCFIFSILKYMYVYTGMYWQFSISFSIIFSTADMIHSYAQAKGCKIPARKRPQTGLATGFPTRVIIKETCRGGGGQRVCKRLQLEIKKKIDCRLCDCRLWWDIYHIQWHFFSLFIYKWGECWLCYLEWKGKVSGSSRLCTTTWTVKSNQVLEIFSCIIFIYMIIIENTYNSLYMYCIMILTEHYNFFFLHALWICSFICWTFHNK